MAMTKKEQAFLESVTQESDMYKSMLYAALGIVEVQRDVPFPKSYSEVSQGWDFNVFSGVYQAWSSFCYHGKGEYNTKGSANQQPRDLFSTKEKAHQAMINEIKLKHAKELAEKYRSQ